MTILAQFLRLRSSMILFIIAAGLISRPTLAQVHFADQVVCSSGVVDYEDAGWNNGGYSIDVEQSACISYSDGDGFDSWVETDDDYGEVFYDEYWSYNQYVTGVGAEAQMSYLDPNNGNSIVVSDSGMIYANSLGTAYAPASYTGQPQFTGYVLQGYYSEENLQGVWSDVAYGISLEMGMLLIPNITVSTSGTPSAVGQPVTFTATVNNTSGPAPTGDIYFEIIRQSSPGWNSGDSTGTISGTTATYTTNALPVGTYDIFIYYSGDSNYVYGQVGNYFYQVVSASLTAPTLSLTTSSASSTAGHPVMFTANISSGATGVLNFLVDGTVIGSRTITSNSATFTTSALTLGTHSISANYSGNQNYSAVSSNTLTQVVTYALQPSGTTDYSYTITPTGGPSGYSSNGNLLSYTDSVNGTWSNIAYDGLNRLSAATQVPVGGVAQSYCWTYDSFGNRTTQATSNQPFVNAPGAATCQVASGATLTGNAWTSYTVNGADQGNNRVVATSAGSYQPDAAGNILSDGVNGYTYDGEGRLCAVAVPQYTGGVILTQYIYDAAGTRVAKGANTNLNAGCDTSGTTFTLTNTYVIGPSGEQLTETDGNGNWLHTNVFGAGKLLATYSYTDYTHTTTDTYFALSDWLGTKRAVVSAGGCGTGYVSLPYGDSLTPSNLPGFTQCPDATENHFTGKERDSESGNDYFGARYFASTTGRFMSPDSDNPQPTNNPQRLNLYTYALNNPLRFIDEDGYTAVDRVNRATSLVGKPYGHNDQPNKYDCSGLAQFSVGSDLSNFPGTGATQYSYADTNGAFTADPSQVQAGDEVFFQNDKGDVVHVGVVEWVDPKTGAIHIVAAAGTKKGVVKQTLPGKGNAGTVWGPQTIKGYGLWHNFDQGASQSKPPRNLWNGIQNLLEQGLFSQRTPPEPPPPPPSGGNSPGAIPTASRWWF